MQSQRNTLDFSGQNIYVGFDVHLHSWKVTILSEKLFHKTFSQDADPEVLYNYLCKHFPGGSYHSAYEAGFCGYWIHNKLKYLGINSMVVNPADIPTTDKERVQKEDSRDSRKIAKALRNGDLKAIHVLELRTLEDRTLVRMRSTLVKDLTRNKNRIKSFLYFHGIKIPVQFCSSKWSKRFINWLKELELEKESGKRALKAIIDASEDLRGSVLNITKEIKLLAQGDVYKEKVDLLRSIPGIGLLTAMTLLTEIETINRFSNLDQFCSFIGLIPSTHSSGETEIASKITRRGHPILRNAIIESAWVAARKDPDLMKCYHQYCRRMEPNRAIIRIAKKLLGRISYVLKTNKAYEYAHT